MSSDSDIFEPRFHQHVFLGEGHEQSERKAWAMIWLCGAMMCVEIIGGLLFGSIALVADGLHMSTHAGALLLAALAYTYARRHAENASFTFGTGKFGDLAGFKVAKVIPGRALILVDPPKDPRPYDNARFIVAAIPGGPTTDEERANFARFSFNSIPGIKDIHLTMSEPIRIESQKGFETVAQAKEANTGEDVVVVQWLRFSGGQFLQMVGISRADIWGTELSRLRSMRDSVAFK